MGGSGRGVSSERWEEADQAGLGKEITGRSQRLPIAPWLQVDPRKQMRP